MIDPPFGVNYTCLRTHRRHPGTHLLYIPHENVKIGCSSLAIYQILSNFTTQKQLDLQLLSGLLFAVQIGRAENLQLLEIKFPYFNCLSHEKSLTLHLCKMYEREVIYEG